MTRSAKAAPTSAGAVTDSAPDTPPAGQPGPSSAAPPGRPAAAIVAALTAVPGATAAQLAQAAGITCPAATRELAELEKTGRAARDRSMSLAMCTARKLPGEAPVSDSPGTPGLRHASSLAPSDAATPDPVAPGTADPAPEQEDVRPAGPARPAGIAPDAGEALGAAAAAAAQAEAALRSGDLPGALAATDLLSQAAARTRRLLRQAGHAARRGPAAGTPPGELRSLVAAHLAAYPAEDFGPHAIGRVLSRSSGAVANALDRLTALGQAQLTCEAPRRYRYAEPALTAS